MKMWNKTLTALVVSVMASCAPGPVAAQAYVDAVTSAAIIAEDDCVEEAIQNYTINLEIGPLVWGSLVIFGIYKLYKHITKPKDMDMAVGEASFKVQGNGNCYINNVVVDGEHVADIEIINKNLYINGIMKRRLASNSIIYNRGKNIFVDGKYVG